MDHTLSLNHTATEALQGTKSWRSEKSGSSHRFKNKGWMWSFGHGLLGDIGGRGMIESDYLGGLFQP